MHQRALLLINRHARQGGEAYDDIAQTFRSAGWELIEDFREDESISDAIIRHRDDADVVIVGGGDGSLNDAITGLRETRLPLGIVPLGTANDLARTLALPTDPVAACQAILTGERRSIDIGEVNGAYFFNVASLGLSVEITRQLDPQLKKRWGVLAYLWTALQVTYRARRFVAEIRTVEETHRVKTLQIAVGNGRHYGGGMTVAEDAAIDDGQLDLYSIEVQHWWQVFLLMPHLMRGTLETSRWVRTLRGTSFEVHTKTVKSINTDGELTTHTPATFRVHSPGITVLVPPTSLPERRT